MSEEAEIYHVKKECCWNCIRFDGFAGIQVCPRELQAKARKCDGEEIAEGETMDFTKVVCDEFEEG